MSGILGPIVSVRTSDLNFYPGNARRGDVDAIAESLRIHGQFQPIIVQKSTDYVLIGNHTLKAAQKLRWAEVDVAHLDVDDDKAKRIVLIANRTADLGTYDLEALAALLSDLDDLSGTGYSDGDLAGLIEGDEPLDDEQDEQEAKPPQYGVVVYCHGPHDRDELLELMINEGRTAHVL